MEECPKKLIKISDDVNNLGVRLVEFDDPNHECLGCAMCATRCPDIAITEVYRG
jgi:2-oxoglutarate ferredoxin oxidoreductase subunit delta